jgi:hypothetical protein
MAASFLFAALAIADGTSAYSGEFSLSDQVDCLVRICRCGQGMSILEGLLLDPGDVPHALKWVNGHPDITSIYVLMVLRERYREAYNGINAETKARVLIAYLKETTTVDDWSRLYAANDQVRAGAGSLKPRTIDGKPAQAILELPASVAVPGLVEILSDREPLAGYGRAAGAWGLLARRCDLAYRYICLLKELPYQFTPSVHAQDQRIAELKKRLAAEK